MYGNLKSFSRWVSKMSYYRKEYLMKKKLGFSEISPQLSIKKQILKNSSYNRFLSRKIDKRLEIRIRKPPLAIRPHTLIKKLLYHQNTLYDNPNPRQKTLSPKPYQTSDDSPGDQSPHYQLFLFSLFRKKPARKKEPTSNVLPRELLSAWNRRHAREKRTLTDVSRVTPRRSRNVICLWQVRFLELLDEEYLDSSGYFVDWCRK